MVLDTNVIVSAYTSMSRNFKCEELPKPMIVEAKAIDKAELPKIKADVEKHIEKAVKNALETAPVSLNDFFAGFDKQQKKQRSIPYS